MNKYIPAVILFHKGFTLFDVIGMISLALVAHSGAYFLAALLLMFLPVVSALLGQRFTPEKNRIHFSMMADSPKLTYDNEISSHDIQAVNDFVNQSMNQATMPKLPKSQMRRFKEDLKRNDERIKKTCKPLPKPLKAKNGKASVK